MGTKLVIQGETGRNGRKNETKKYMRVINQNKLRINKKKKINQNKKKNGNDTGQWRTDSVAPALLIFPMRGCHTSPEENTKK